MMNYDQREHSDDRPCKSSYSPRSTVQGFRLLLGFLWAV